MPALNLKNIQGDIIFGLPKRTQVRWEREGASASLPLQLPSGTDSDYAY